MVYTTVKGPVEARRTAASVSRPSGPASWSQAAIPGRGRPRTLSRALPTLAAPAAGGREQVADRALEHRQHVAALHTLGTGVLVGRVNQRVIDVHEPRERQIGSETALPLATLDHAGGARPQWGVRGIPLFRGQV